MRIARWFLAAASGCLLSGVLMAAQDEAQPDGKRSGLDYVSPETRAMQEDDTSNPGMLWVVGGETLWNKAEGEKGQSCASCHGDAAESMQGVAARYPVFDPATKRPIDLQGRVNQCRESKQEVAPFAYESEDLLALTAYVAKQSREMPVAPDADARLAPYRENGRRLYEQRIGQLDLACNSCHDGLAGQRLAGALIPQAHPTAYPLYRLEWQTLGSLQRRLRNCMIGVRAEPYAYGSLELIELELYLMSRAEGLHIETPGVRP
ncbi:MAG: sulfur oxidation c-type cytochrome SoxA [Amphiplicatus sp.]